MSKRQKASSDTNEEKQITTQEDRNQVIAQIENNRTTDPNFTSSNRATLVFLLTISMLFLYNTTEIGSYFGIQYATPQSINEAIMVAAQNAAQVQASAIAQDATVRIADPQAQLNILNAVRDYASQTRFIMWGYSHTANEWVQLLREVSPEYIGPILDICFQILSIFRNLSAGARLVVSDVGDVLSNLSQGNVPIASLARLQSYANIFYALSPIIAGIAGAARLANDGVRTITGNSILGLLLSGVSISANAAANTTLSIVDFIASVVCSVPQDPSLMQGDQSPASTVSSDTMSVSTVGYGGGLHRLADMLVNMVSEIDEIMNQPGSSNESAHSSITAITQSLNTLSTHSQSSVLTYQTAVEESIQAINNPGAGIEEISGVVSNELRIDIDVTPTLASAGQTIPLVLGTLIGNCEVGTQTATEGSQGDSQISDITMTTAQVDCTGLDQLARVAVALNFAEAMAMIKHRNGQLGGKRRNRKTRKNRRIRKTKSRKYKGLQSKRRRNSHRKSKSKK